MKEEIEKAGLGLNIQETKVMTLGPITSWQVNGGENGNSDRFLPSWASLWMVTVAMKLKDTCSL